MTARLRTLTLDQAANNFIVSFRNHLQPGKAARSIDPRDCDQCLAAFDDLVFTLDGVGQKQAFKPIDGELKLTKNAVVIDLFNRS